MGMFLCNLLIFNYKYTKNFPATQLFNTFLIPNSSYYKEYVSKHLKHLFPRQVSYNRFVELKKDV